MSLLPKAWLACQLGDVLDYGVANKAEPNEIPDDAWVLELEDIEKDTSRILQRITFKQRQSKSTKNRFSSGDVLYGKLRPYLNKVVRADQDGYCTTEIIPLSPSQWLNGSYLYYWLKHPTFLEYVASVSHGLSMPRLGTDSGRAAPFLLAPINEQRRIAGKLDSLFAKVNACHDRLDRVPTIINRFRKSVLGFATSGILTEDWRSGDISKWTHEKAIDVCEKVQSGGTPKEGFSQTGIPFLKVYNMVDQKINFEHKPQYITPAIHHGSLSKSQVKPDDVLMNIVGPPLGKVAIVPSNYREWNINQAITLFRPSSRISSGWLYCILCGGKNIAEIIHLTRGSAGQTNISLSQCRDFIFPVPPVEEQSEIVRRVETLFSYADRLETRYAAARSKVENLASSLLAKAFCGNLVPQDSSDESASLLLKRIRLVLDVGAKKENDSKRTQRQPMRNAITAEILKDGPSDFRVGRR